MGLHDILSLSARTLKVFDLSVLFFISPVTLAANLQDSGKNWKPWRDAILLEAFSFEVQVNDNVTEDLVGSIFRQEEVLVKPGWSASVLRQVSFKVGIRSTKYSQGAKLSEALQSLPGKYLSHLLIHKSVAFNFSAYTSTQNEKERKRTTKK